MAAPIGRPGKPPGRPFDHGSVTDEAAACRHGGSGTPGAARRERASCGTCPAWSRTSTGRCSPTTRRSARVREPRPRPGSCRALGRGRAADRPAAGPDRQDRVHRAELPRPRRARRAPRSPTEPILFMKAPDTVVGPDDTVLVPRGSVKTDWEVELAVVIGRTARYLESDEEALAPGRRLRGRARRLRAGVPDRARRPVGQGQELRDVQPAGPVAGDRRRGRRPAGARPAAVGQRRAASRTARPPSRSSRVAEVVRYVSQFMTLVPGRRHQHRHPGRRRHGPPGAQAVPAGRGRGGAGDRRPGPAAPGACATRSFPTLSAGPPWGSSPVLRHALGSGGAAAEGKNVGFSTRSGPCGLPRPSAGRPPARAARPRPRRGDRRPCRPRAAPRGDRRVVGGVVAGQGRHGAPPPVSGDSPAPSRPHSGLRLRAPRGGRRCRGAALAQGGLLRVEAVLHVARLRCPAPGSAGRAGRWWRSSTGGSGRRSRG